MATKMDNRKRASAKKKKSGRGRAPGAVSAPQKRTTAEWVEEGVSLWRQWAKSLVDYKGALTKMSASAIKSDRSTIIDSIARLEGLGVVYAKAREELLRWASAASVECPNANIPHSVFGDKRPDNIPTLNPSTVRTRVRGDSEASTLSMARATRVG